MAKRRKRRYSGALNQPIVRPPGLLFGPNSQVGKRYVVRVRLAKLVLLLGHYGIDAQEAGPWVKLAYRLASDHVPGMRVIDAARKIGAPRKWDPARDQEVLTVIDQILPEKKGRVTEAISAAKKRGLLSGQTTSLKTRYYEAKKRFAASKTFPTLAEIADDLDP
jgi:hypothetical protein